jgi:hypothetical protein
MPATQQRIVLVVVLRTYGDHGRKEAELSLGLLHELTGQDKGTLRRALRDLIAEGVIRVLRPAMGRRPQVLALQKDYETWGRYAVREVNPGSTVGAAATVGGAATVGTEATVGREATVGGEATMTVAERPPYRPPKVGRAATTIEKSIENKEKNPPTGPPMPARRAGTLAESGQVLRGELVEDSSFDDFWRSYPNRQAKPLAAKRWERLDPGARGRAIEVAAVMRESVRRGYRDVSLCPHAATFLNQTRYDDWYDEAGVLVVPPGYGPRVAHGQSRSRDLIAQVMQEDYA